MDVARTSINQGTTPAAESSHLSHNASSHTDKENTEREEKKFSIKEDETKTPTLNQHVIMLTT